MKRRRILWMSDTPTAFSGFATVTRDLLLRLHRTGRYEIACVGWGCRGWPYDRAAFPYDIYPSDAQQYGRDVLPQAVLEFKPDVVVCFGDLWMVGWTTVLPQRDRFSLCLYYPLDGRPLHPDLAKIVQAADLPITYSQFARETTAEAVPGLPVGLIYHGVDSRTFRPLPDREALRRRLDLDGRFVVGCVARNQPRKNYPTLIDGFARFAARRPDVLLYLHTDPLDIGWDVPDLLRRFGVADRTVIAPKAKVMDGVAAESLNETYNLFDVMALPTGGEGFGLPILEAASAGVPVIATDYSSCPELVAGRGELIRVKEFLITGRFNMESALPDAADLAAKLDRLYETPLLREQYARAGRAFAETLDWDEILPQWDEILRRPSGPRSAGVRLESPADPPAAPGTPPESIDAVFLPAYGEGWLKHSLRSLAKNAPWVRQVFVVVNGQTPSWLDAGHPGLSVVSYRDLFCPQESAPAFNPGGVELRLHRLPRLSRRFLYCSDGGFVGRPISPADYLNERGGQRVFLENAILPTDPAHGPIHDRRCAGTQKVLDRLIAPRPGRLYPAGCPQLFDRDALGRLEELLADDFQRTAAQPSGSPDGLVLRVLHAFFVLESPEAASLHERVLLRRFSSDYYPLALSTDGGCGADSEGLRELEMLRPKFFCVDDNRTTTPDASLVQHWRQFLEAAFPEPSPFEKQRGRDIVER